MSLSIRRDAPALTILIALFAATAWAWPQAPAVVPTHWGVDGTPDGWGGRGVGLLLLPFVALGTWILMLLLPRLDPGRANYPTFWGSYAVLRTALVAFFALIHSVAIAAALGSEVNMGRVLAPATGLLFMVLGGVMGKIRPNWFVGVRTPWTLTSKLAWTRTHRFVGWTWVLGGAAVILAGLVSPTAGFVTMMVVAIGGALAGFVYSYVVWRGDPDRQTPGGTTPAP